jgi:hypothetical protein
VRLHLPPIRLVAGSEVACSSGVVLEGPQQPVENGLSEGAAVGIAQSATVSYGNVTFPRRNTRCKVLEVAFTLVLH